MNYEQAQALLDRLKPMVEATFEAIEAHTDDPEISPYGYLGMMFVALSELVNLDPVSETMAIQQVIGRIKDPENTTEARP